MPGNLRKRRETAPEYAALLPGYWLSCNATGFPLSRERRLRLIDKISTASIGAHFQAFLPQTPHQMAIYGFRLTSILKFIARA